MTGRRKKENRGKASAPAPTKSAPTRTARFVPRRWILALLVAFGVAGLVLVWVLSRAAPLPIAPPDMDRLDPEVRRLVEEQLRRAKEERSAGSHGTLGLVYEANGMWPEAEQSFGFAAELARGDPLWQLHRGIALVQLGRFDAALAAFRQVVAEDEGSAAAHHRLADLLLSTGATEEALEHFQTAVRLAPDRSEGHAGLGAALLQTGELEPARDHLARAVELDPGYRSAHYRLGQTCRALGRSEEAARELALGVDGEERYIPDSLAGRLQSFRVSYRSRLAGAKNLVDGGRAAEGIAVLEALWQQHPSDTVVINDLAVAHLHHGDAERAHELLLKAREIDEREFATWINLAAWGLKTGELDQALDCADRAVELAGEVSSAHLVRGNVLLKKGRHAEAQAALETAVRLDARNPDAHHSLARACSRLGRYEEARSSLLAATRLAPTRWEAFLDLSQIQVLLGNLEEARRALACARRIVPEHPLVAGMAREIERRAAGSR